jgi:hypothetical protein
MGTFKLKRLHDVEVKKQYQVNVIRFAALENLDDEDDDVRGWACHIHIKI